MSYCATCHDYHPPEWGCKPPLDHTEDEAEGPATKEPEQSPAPAEDATTYLQYCISNRIPIPVGGYHINNPITFPLLPPGSHSEVVVAAWWDYPLGCAPPAGQIYYGNPLSRRRLFTAFFSFAAFCFGP